MDDMAHKGEVPMAALRDDFDMLRRLDTRCADWVDTAEANAEGALEWLRYWHPDGGVHDADLAGISLSGFCVGFMLAAQLASEDCDALQELHGLLRRAATLREVEHPDMTLGLHRKPPWLVN